PSSIHFLRDTVIAAGPRMVVALGAVALRSFYAAAALVSPPVFDARTEDTPGRDRQPIRLPTVARLEAAGSAAATRRRGRRRLRRGTLSRPRGALPGGTHHSRPSSGSSTRAGRT